MYTWLYFLLLAANKLSFVLLDGLVLVAHATQELALGPLERPLRLEGFFGFVNQVSDCNGLCGAVSVGPVESLHVLRSHCAVARLADAHAKLLVVDDFTSAYVARVCLVPTLLMALHAVAKPTEGLALFEFPLLRFRHRDSSTMCSRHSPILSYRLCSGRLRYVSPYHSERRLCPSSIGARLVGIVLLWCWDSWLTDAWNPGT